jgi:hypothetical protein
MVAKTVHIQVLGAHDDENVISGPLDASAPVVVAGNHQLQDGMKVRLTQAAESDQGGDAHKSDEKSDKAEKPASKSNEAESH